MYPIHVSTLLYEVDSKTVKSTFIKRVNIWYMIDFLLVFLPKFERGRELMHFPLKYLLESEKAE